MLEPNEPVTIVGAGLIGSLLALELGRRGHSVTVLERRADMRREAISAGRSINLAVSARGLHALEAVGLRQSVLAQAVAMRGRMVHALDGALTFQPYGADASECIYSISRGELNKTLMTAAEATGRVEIRFNTRVDAAQLEPGKLVLHDERTQATSELSVGTLFGTDGSASAIRKAILEQPGARGSDDYLDYAYKELAILPLAGSSGAKAFRLEPNALHIWPRGRFMLIALPNHDGSFTVTLFLPLEEAHPSFDTLREPDAVRAFFSEYFRDVMPMLHELERTFATNPTGRMVTLRTTPWNFGDRVLLLGDAAHAIVPFFGQGMNCGFEDITVLFEALAAARSRNSPLAGLFERYGRERKPDSDAIATMAVENFLEMRDKVGNARFLLEKEAEKILERELPGEYVSRYRLVSFHRVPYRVALAVGRIQDELLEELCRGLRSVEELDLARAKRLVAERLTPLWSAHARG